MNTRPAELAAIKALGLSTSKLGYIIANSKNLEKLLSLSFTAVRSEHFSGHVDGLMPVEQTIEEAKQTARDIIKAGRCGRGIAVYDASSSVRDLPGVSIGDCCYDVTFYLPEAI